MLPATLCSTQPLTFTSSVEGIVMYKCRHGIVLLCLHAVITHQLTQLNIQGLSALQTLALEHNWTWAKIHTASIL